MVFSKFIDQNKLVINLYSIMNNFPLVKFFKAYNQLCKILKVSWLTMISLIAEFILVSQVISWRVRLTDERTRGRRSLRI